MASSSSASGKQEAASPPPPPLSTSTMVVVEVDQGGEGAAAAVSCQQQHREIIRPSVGELSKEVRTNILCTVEGCGKILPNPPALNMHLVKSHRVKDGLVNPTVRKDMKGSKKLYCCPIEGCPRGPHRPFSQFSLVKQHFMKMHAEKKHKCSKCNNGYSTEWDLRRHAEDCGKTYCCTCGCPYASRAALLSHVYRTGHEVPTEHRIPPVKKRKMEKLMSGSVKEKPKETTCCQITVGGDREWSEAAGPLRYDPTMNSASSESSGQVATRVAPKLLQKLLLPKPKIALVNVPLMQLAHLPVLLPSTESGALRSVVLAVDSQGSLSALHLLPQGAMRAVVPQMDAKNLLGFKNAAGLPASSRSSLGSLTSMTTGVQASLETSSADAQGSSLGGWRLQRGRSTSTNIQTDMSYLSRVHGGMGVCTAAAAAESSVSSSCAQTDISVSAQVLLPVSVETQTFSSSSPRSKATSTIAAQTDIPPCLGHQIPCTSTSSSSSASSTTPYITRQTQTILRTPVTGPDSDQQAIMFRSDLFDSSSVLNVSTQTAALGMDVSLAAAAAGNALYEDEEKSGVGAGMCFGVQTDELNPNSVAVDNQTQTMTSMLSDLENILSGHQVLADDGVGCGGGPGGSVQDQQHTGPGIDFDFEEFLNAVHIQTQTEESELGALGAAGESLDIQTQTDCLLLDQLDHRGSSGDGAGQSGRTQSDLEMAMFDTQTQTDLNFLLNAGSHHHHMPHLGSILHQSSFSMSTESSDTETQTDIIPSSSSSSLPQTSLSSSAQLATDAVSSSSSSQSEHNNTTRLLSSAETQTVSSHRASSSSSSSEGQGHHHHHLGHLFLTSNETQTVMDDFLSADMAWGNMESHFSSVETQTCEELCAALFQQQHPEKPDS